MGDSQDPFATLTLLSPPDAPIPTTAVNTLGVIRVTFDRPILNQPLATGNWSGRLNNKAFSVTSAVVAPPSSVDVTTGPGPADVGPDEIAYAATPADVVSLAGGTPAAAFANFPVS
jgi:hypothetical protein